jgi:hypothetical protein
LEGEMSGLRYPFCALLSLMTWLGSAAYAQQVPNETAEINLRKSVVVREFGGKPVSGEERQIGRGDSLWRILVQEKGLPERSFRSYLVIIGGLNPEIKNLDVLRVGDKIFIPLRFSDASGGSSAADAQATASAQAAGEQTVEYRVRAGESLYGIIRDRFKLTDERKVAQYVVLIKDLNPHRKRTWDSLQEGEIIRLPVVEGSGLAKSTPDQFAASGAAASRRPLVGAGGPGRDIARSADPERVLRSPARENMPILVKVIHATGNQIQQSGEEVIALPDERVRFDRANYPVIYNAALRQKLVVDRDGKLPLSLKTKLNDPRIGTPVLSMGDGVTIENAVRQMLIGFGYQPLPNERPVVVQQSGIAFEAKGHWMALAPATSNTMQELVVISLSETANPIPEYLAAELAKQGLHLRNVVLSNTQSDAAPTVLSPRASVRAAVKQWPAGKIELLDAVLTSLGVPFKREEMFTVELSAGLRVETRVDRMIQADGKWAAIFFRRGDPETFRALHERHGIKAIGLDLAPLSSRDLISRVLELTGQAAAYSEHRFPLAPGSAAATTALTAWGFQLEKKGMFVTDRQIPPGLHQFFFEKGLDIIYFR